MMEQGGLQHGEEQERENRTARVKALQSMLASSISGRAKKFVKQGLSDRKGMIAFVKTREDSARLLEWLLCQFT